MKTFALLVVSLLLLVSGAFADMVLVEIVTQNGMPNVLTLKFKEEKVRTDIGPEVSTLLDIKSGDVTVLRPINRNYMKISAQRAKELLERFKVYEKQSGETASVTGTDNAAGQVVPKPESAPEPVVPPELSPTGRKEIISGFNTEEYAGKSGDIKVRYWIATGFPNWQGLKMRLEKAQENMISLMSSGAVPDVSGLPGMPVKIEFEREGKPANSVTILSVRDAPLDAADFEIPRNFKELRLPKSDNNAKSEIK